jgi:hypothetical protein
MLADLMDSVYIFWQLCVLNTFEPMGQAIHGRFKRFVKSLCDLLTILAGKMLDSDVATVE